MQHGIYIKNYDSTYFSGCKNIFGSPLSAYYFLARDKYMFYVTIKLQCFDVKLQRQERLWLFIEVKNNKISVFRLSHDAVTCDVDRDLSTSHC